MPLHNRSTPLGSLDQAIRLFEGISLENIRKVAQDLRIEPLLPCPLSVFVWLDVGCSCNLRCSHRFQVQSFGIDHAGGPVVFNGNRHGFLQRSFPEISSGGYNRTHAAVAASYGRQGCIVKPKLVSQSLLAAVDVSAGLVDEQPVHGSQSGRQLRGDLLAKEQKGTFYFLAGLVKLPFEQTATFDKVECLLLLPFSMRLFHPLLHAGLTRRFPPGPFCSPPPFFSHVLSLALNAYAYVPSPFRSPGTPFAETAPARR